MEQALRKDVAAGRIGAELDLVHRQELDLAVQRHGLDRTDIIGRTRRDDLFLAGDQGHAARTPCLDDSLIDLAGQKPKGQADHARGMAQHPLDRQVRLAGVGGP